MPKAKESFASRKFKAEQIFGVATERPQDSSKEYLKERRRSIYPKDFVTHPRPDSVQDWTFREDHLQITQVSLPATRRCPIVVDTTDSFASMMLDIENKPTLGFDVEGHMQYSYGNMISLMQISTFDVDYLIDPFKLHQEIRLQLKIKLEDPKTLLIVHGGANDLLWLKGEFRIFPLGVFDTQVYHMVRTGNTQGISFDSFKEKYLTSCLGAKARYDKSLCQLADWRIRPLPKELKIYSSEDSHLVLLGFNEILKQGDMCSLNTALVISKDLVLKPWEPPKFSYESQIKKLKHTFKISKEKFPTFDLLWRFQVYLGKLLDQNPASFFGITALAALVEKEPIDRISFGLTVGRLTIPKTIPWQAEYSYLRLLHKGEKAFEDFQKLRCNICNILSHPAWACSENQTGQTRKFHSRNFETPEQRHAQNHRRMTNKRVNKKLKEEADKTSKGYGKR